MRPSFRKTIINMIDYFIQYFRLRRQQETKQISDNDLFRQLTFSTEGIKLAMCSDLRTSDVVLENIAVFGSHYLRTKRPLGSHYLRMSAH